MKIIYLFKFQSSDRIVKNSKIAYLSQRDRKDKNRHRLVKKYLKCHLNYM